ncbi:MAG: SpoIVB peptidase S55 domain-containing protein [Verrucomicrobiota bacterium JB024]|nr:SpoIVB peptidase S55 domain-containing protein [Verrucomicrobiota bacterium JB024]
MKRFFLSLPGLTALLFFHSAGAQPPPISAPTLPVSEVKPGMQGEWKTVISGSQIETFRFEVLGTARNFTGPQRDVIIARALDESQIVSGPVAGMSGSPCFIDGKLVGAYAYGYSWPKAQSIIGI